MSNLCSVCGKEPRAGASKYCVECKAEAIERHHFDYTKKRNRIRQVSAASAAFNRIKEFIATNPTLEEFMDFFPSVRGKFGVWEKIKKEGKKLSDYEG